MNKTSNKTHYKKLAIFTLSPILALAVLILFDNTGYDVKLDTNFDGYITASDITEIYNVILGM